MTKLRYAEAIRNVLGGQKDLPLYYADKRANCIRLKVEGPEFGCRLRPDQLDSPPFSRYNAIAEMLAEELRQQGATVQSVAVEKLNAGAHYNYLATVIRLA